MEHEILSETYRHLYNNIIGEYFSQICQSDINYCIKNKNIYNEIWKKFEEYKCNAIENMSGARLDRHKLASCLCAAIIEVKPLVGYKGAKIVKQANEILALHVGINVIKFYMMYDFLHELDISSEFQKELSTYLREQFNMQFPSENICDIQSYEENILNALYWSHQKCDITNRECFRFDIWAYSKIFYHLELYNKDFLSNAYHEYAKAN